MSTFERLYRKSTDFTEEGLEEFLAEVDEGLPEIRESFLKASPEEVDELLVESIANISESIIVYNREVLGRTGWHNDCTRENLMLRLQENVNLGEFENVIVLAGMVMYKDIMAGN